MFNFGRESALRKWETKKVSFGWGFGALFGGFTLFTIYLVAMQISGMAPESGSQRAIMEIAIGLNVIFIIFILFLFFGPVIKRKQLNKFLDEKKRFEDELKGKKQTTPQILSWGEVKDYVQG